MTEWYRNKAWDDAIRADFFARLKRARSQRDQYLVIQALELAEAEPEVALELVDHYFETRTDDFDDVRAQLARTRALVAAGHLGEASEAYRQTLDVEARNPTLKVGAALDYVVFVVTHGVIDRYSEAEALLGPEPDVFLLPVEGFRYHAARAILAADAGDADRARRHRKEALAEAKRTHSGLPQHPKLGLVGDAEAPLRQRLDESVR